MEWACFSVMSFLVLSGHSVGRFFSHTWSEWVLVNLPLVESTCFVEHWVLLRDQRMRQEHRRLPGDLVRVTVAKCSKPGAARKGCVHRAGKGYLDVQTA